MSTIESTKTADAVRARFDAIRAEIDAAVQRREELFITAQAELIAAGIDCAVVSDVYSKFEAGQRVILWDECHRRDNGSVFSQRSITLEWLEHRREDDDRYGPYDYGWRTHISHGAYDIVTIEDRKALLVKVEQDDEAGHKRAVSRLRNRAKAEHLRVRARDQEVALISPMNDVVHEGDVNSAYLWLCGIDAAEVTA